MTSAPRIAIAAAVLAAAAAGAYAYLRAPSAPPAFQGWVEAQLIFVSPDEAGRVETLSVREGDAIEAGAPLFKLDDDLQRAASAEAEAALANARITYDRAKELLKRNVGSQKTADDAESTLRTAEAKLNSARTKLERRKVNAPVTGTIQEVYFRQGEMVAAGRPIVATSAANTGIEAAPGSEILVADEADGFAAAVIRLLGSPQEASWLGAAARTRASRSAARRSGRPAGSCSLG